MPGIGLAGEPGREDDAAPLLPAQEAVAPGGVVGRETVAGDGDQPAAIGETGERSAEVLGRGGAVAPRDPRRSEEHTSELQSLMRISSAVFCLKKKHRIQINTK